MSEKGNVFKNCLAKLKKKIKGIEVTPETIITILRFAMEIVEVTTLKGEEQNKMVNKLVRQIVEESPVSENKRQLLLNMIDNGLLSETINLVVDATRGEIEVNAAAKVAVGCCWQALYKRKRRKR